VFNGTTFFIIAMRDGKPTVISTSPSPVVGFSMAVSPAGDRIVVTGFPGEYVPREYASLSPEKITTHLFSLSSGKIVYRHDRQSQWGLHPTV
jgi:hypothetical protein